MATKQLECQECGEQFIPRQHRAAFCSDLCRSDFNHRRHKRGAELYDLVMHAHTSGDKDADKVVSRVVAAYLDGDKAKRSGRKSWQPISYALMRIPMAYSKDGDRR